MSYPQTTFTLRGKTCQAGLWVKFLLFQSSLDVVHSLLPSSVADDKSDDSLILLYKLFVLFVWKLIEICLFPGS